MAGLADVLLRGCLLVFGSVALGAMAWVHVVLRAETHTKPDAPTGTALRLAAGAAGLAALTQATVMLVALGALGGAEGGWPLGAYLRTSSALTALVRIGLGVLLAVAALRLARGPAGRGWWLTAAVAAVALVGLSAGLSHAVARLEDRALLLGLDALHQIAAAIWVGGLASCVVTGAARSDDPVGGPRPELGGSDAADTPRDLVLRRFSRMAFVSVTVLVLAGGAMSLRYVGERAALGGTAFGVMILTKVVLLAAALVLASANFRAVRRGDGGRRLGRLVEAELGLGVTVLFAAASLTSLPPAVDVTADRATLAEVAARFAPAVPRIVSPPIDDLLRQADPLMAPVGVRQAVERAWSEYNHHWAGLFVLGMGLLAALERLGVRRARHWPLLFLGLAVFLFIRNDPRAWPLGPAGFWESLALPDVLQHRAFVVLVVAFGVFEWMVRTGRLPAEPWAHVFPLLCAVGGGLLLTHSHAMFSLKEEFLTELSHAPIGVLGAVAGWARWLDVRLPEAARPAGWVWTGCLCAVGLLLLFYRES